MEASSYAGFKYPLCDLGQADEIVVGKVGNEENSESPNKTSEHNEINEGMDIQAAGKIFDNLTGPYEENDLSSANVSIIINQRPRISEMMLDEVAMTDAEYVFSNIKVKDALDEVAITDAENVFSNIKLKDALDEVSLIDVGDSTPDIVVNNAAEETMMCDVSDSRPDVTVNNAVDDVVLTDVENGVRDVVISPEGRHLDFIGIPFQITGSWKEFEHTSQNNFTKGCKWSPDGSCILTCSEDAKMRLFNLPMELCETPINWECVSEMSPALCVSEAELIYDYSWYPLMSSLNPISCCFASSCRCNPVHMWDAFTGEMRCTYRPYNHVDEIVSAHSVAFNADGQKLFCGFKNMIRIFDVSIPGRNCQAVPTCVKKCGQKGIISCFAFSAENRSVFAAGSYNKTVGIYSESDGSLLHLLDHQKGGITHMCFSPDGCQLYSGSRKDPEIQCWDLKNMRKPLFQLRRICNTNQRLYFDISRCGQYVISGNQNGVVTVWDVKQPSKQIFIEETVILEPVQFYQAHNDCVNGVSIHPNLPFLATSSGQRKFPEPLDSEGEESDGAMFTDKHIVKDNSVRLWWIGTST